MKVNRATQLMENGIESHDDIVEQALLTTSTNGFLGAPHAHLGRRTGVGRRYRRGREHLLRAISRPRMWTIPTSSRR
jgi:hypothetical protein